MDEDLVHTIRGAALGAIVGGLLGWILYRRQGDGQGQEHELSPRNAFSLGLAVLAILRQIADM